MAEKIYRAATGVDEFYYGEIDEATNALVTEKNIERVKFLQTINIEMPQEIVRAYGDNRTAEMATSSGDISVTGGFHKIPLEDKERLLGWEKIEGIYSVGSNDISPYVAVIFARTYEDGSKEYVGLPKGLFTRPNVEGQTKEDSVEFSSEEIEAQFMDRKVEGFTDEKSVLFAVDKKGETANRDKMVTMLFGATATLDDTDPEGA